MSNPIKNGSVIVDTCTKRILALRKHVTSNAEVSINGKSYKLPALIKVFQANLDSRASVATKRAELEAALTNRSDAEATRRAVDKGLKAWVANEFGASSSQAHEFGYPPAKVATKSSETKHNAVLQARATRKARHTLGKNQKSEIKGTIVAPAEPAAPASIIKGTVVVVPSSAASPAADTKANGASAPPLTNGASPH